MHAALLWHHAAHKGRLTSSLANDAEHVKWSWLLCQLRTRLPPPGRTASIKQREGENLREDGYFTLVEWELLSSMNLISATWQYRQVSEAAAEHQA